MKRTGLLSMPAAAALLLAGAPVRAGHDFAMFLPDSALGVLMVPDGEAMRAFWDASALGMLARDPEMEPFLAKVGQVWTDGVARPFGAKTGLDMSELGVLLRHAFAAALVAPSSAGDEPSMIAIVAAGGGPGEESAEDLAGLLVRMVSGAPGVRPSVETFRGAEIRRFEFDVPQAPANDEAWAPGAAAAPAGTPRMQRMFVASQGGMCVAVAGGDARAHLESVLAGIQAGSAARPLARSPASPGALRPLEEPGAVRFFMAPAALASMIVADEPPQIQLILDAIGIRNLEGFLAESGRNGTAEWGFLHLYAPKGKRGLLKLVDLERIPTEPPRFVGADAASYGVYGLDISRLFAELLSVVETVQPEAANMIRGVILMAGGQAPKPIDIQKEIIGAFGPGIMSVSSYPRPFAPGNERTAMMLGSRNPEGMIQALRSLLRPSPESPSMLEEREYMGRTIYSIEMPARPSMMEEDEPANAAKICMTTLPGWLVTAGDIESLEAMIRSLDGAEQPLALSDEYRQALAMLPAPQGSLEYSNLRTMVEYLVALGAKGQEIFGMLPADAGVPLPSGEGEVSLREMAGWLDLLPAPERVARHFGVMVTVGETMPDGTVFRSVSPRPPGL